MKVQIKLNSDENKNFFKIILNLDENMQKNCFQKYY